MCNLKFDKDTRTLKADYNWAPRAFQNIVSVNFELTFSQNFKEVVDGKWLTLSKEGVESDSGSSALKQYVLHVDKDKKKVEEPKKASIKNDDVLDLVFKKTHSSGQISRCNARVMSSINLYKLKERKEVVCSQKGDDVSGGFKLVPFSDICKLD